MSNLNILREELVKVEKGCNIFFEDKNKRYCYCGKKYPLIDIELCPTCQARLEALNLGIQAVENTIKDDIEFLQSIMCFAMFSELTARLDILRTQLQKEITK